MINRLYASTIALQDVTPTWTTAAAISSTDETVLDDYRLELNDSDQAVAVWLSNPTTETIFNVHSATSTINPPTNIWSSPLGVSNP